MQAEGQQGLQQAMGMNGIPENTPERGVGVDLLLTITATFVAAVATAAAGTASPAADCLGNSWGSINTAAAGAFWWIGILAARQQH
jgi:hypothetical protein